jgi:hypothetical protein
MATMYPCVLPSEVRDSPQHDAECAVFDSLAHLPGDYRVFYSVDWIARTPVDGAREGEADFVIAHPKYGIIVVEVKGGFVTRDPSSGLWLTKTRGAGNIHEIKNPVAQARRSKHHLAEKLASLPRWFSGKPKVGHAVAFPHCESHDQGLGLACPPEMILYATDLDDIEPGLRRIYEYWSGSKNPCTPLDATKMRALSDLLAPRVELRPALRLHGAKIAAAEVKIAELTIQQERVLRALAKNRRVSVSGGAGTGKTMLALAKAKHLAEQGFRTLLTCYNRPLADHLRAAARGCDLLEVADFHQFCMMTISAAGRFVGPTGDPEYWETTVPNAVADALPIVPTRRFDAIVVDEAQDFADGWWVPLQLAMEDSGDGILYIFFDDNQRLYKRAASFPEKMVEYCLCDNLRNTKPIHRAAAQFYSGGELIAAGPDGPAVELILAPDSTMQKKEIGKALDRFIKAGVSPDDIAVLTGRSVSSSRVGGSLFGSYRWTNDQSTEPGLPLFESIARFKGLERAAVILVELEDHVSAERDESIYVGLSRARSSLTVIGDTSVLAYVRGELPSAEESKPPTDYMRALLGQD